jgi:LL-diaminopimelate aminotransferase
MPSSAARLNTLPPYVFAIIAERIRQMRADGLDVIRLDIGSPDMPPPNTVVEVLAESAHQAGHHGYTGYRGTDGFRQAISRYYAQRFDVDLDPYTEVLPLIGSKEGIVNFSLAFLDSGDTALVPGIAYPSYAMGCHLAGGTVHWLHLHQENGYLPDLASIPDVVAARAKIIWVNYPNNPTGAVAETGFYEELVDFCRVHDILMASDNPYVDVTYDGYVAGSALQTPGAKTCTVEFMSLSKTYNMAGWRLGAAVGNAEALKTLLRIKSNVDSGHFHAVYDAGVEALESTPQEWINKRNNIYRARRDRVLAALRQIGLEAGKPKGAMYIWAKVLDGDSRSYQEEALSAAHVSIAPGETYGPDGEGYVRLSLSTADDRLDEALERLIAWYASR